MSKDWVADIHEMHEHYGLNDPLKKMDSNTLCNFLCFRIDFLQEELTEMEDSVVAEDVVDALIDLCVVAIGTLESFNVDSYKAWDRVLEANMAKRVGISKRLNPLGLPDLVKPEGWVAPSHEDNVGLLSEIY